MSMRQSFPLAALIACVITCMAIAQPEPKPADAKPEPKPTTPETKPEVKPEAKPPETKPETNPEAKPSTPEEPAKPLQIKVTAAKGQVQFRATEDQPWLAVKVGLELPIGAEVRTGLRSVCQFTIDGNHAITLDRLGVVKVLDAIKRDGRVKTDIGMKYGRTQYKVESNAAEHDAKVHAPAATLAVRGSFVIVEDNAAFGSVAIVNESRQSIYTPRFAGTFPGSAAAMRIVPIELVTGRVEQPIDKAGRPDGPGEVAMRDTINDLVPAVAQASELERDLIAKYPLYNGAGGTGVADIRKIIDEVVDEPASGPTFTTGFLNIIVNVTGDITLFAREPGSGLVISTTPGNPPGSTNIIRDDGPAPAFASGGSFDRNIHYGNGIPVGTFNYFIKLDSGTSASFNVQVHRNIPGGSTLILKDFSGSVTVGNPIFSDSFSVQPSPAVP